MNSTIQDRAIAPEKAAKARRSALIPLLGILLALQLVAALLLGLGGNDLSPAASQGPLIAFEANQVSRLRIASSERELVLERADDGWQLPELGGFPATEFKVSELLDKLAGVQKRIPVATSETAIARFKVADDDFERRLTLEGADGPIGTLYLGDSPGFRRLFVRAAGEPAVYEADIALFDAADKTDDWTKKTVLQLEPEQIRRVEIADMVLTRGDDDNWSLEDLAEGETLDQDAVKELLRKIANLSFRGVLGTEDKPEYGQNSPAMVFRVGLGEQTLEYRLSKPAEGVDHVLKVSNRPHYFSLAQYSVEDLTGVARGELVSGGGADETAGGIDAQAESAIVVDTEDTTDSTVSVDAAATPVVDVDPVGATAPMVDIEASQEGVPETSTPTATNN